MIFYYPVLYFQYCLACSTCAVAKDADLKFFDKYIIPASYIWKGVPFDGLSAIRWHASEGEELMLFLIIEIRQQKANHISINLKSTFLMRALKILWTNSNTIFKMLHKKGFIDTEGTVINPENHLIWSSEAGSPLRKSTLTGRFAEDLGAIFPPEYSVSRVGLSFTPDNKYLFVAGRGR